MKREKRELTPKAKSGMKGLIAIVRQLERIKREGRAFGIFTDDRELLTKMWIISTRFIYAIDEKNKIGARLNGVKQFHCPS